MNFRLFVYGTLLSTAGHPMARRLQRDARLIGAATVPGQLHSLGRYPGLVEVPEKRGTASALVHGEVYTLKTPAITLRWLDAYEGIMPLRPEESPYARVERLVQLDSGETLSAWVYVYLKNVRRHPQLPGGRWSPPKG